MTDFSVGQKLAMASIFLGSLVVGLGFAAPYWIVVSSQDGKSLYANTFYACVKVPGQAMECKISDLTDTSPKVLAMRICGASCVGMSLLCGIVAMCLACCNAVSHLFGLGIVCFLAAAAGAVAPGLWVLETSDYVGQSVAYGWAFYVFCAGLPLLGLSSIVACVATPDNPLGRYVFHRPGSSVILSHANSNGAVLPLYNTPVSTVYTPQVIAPTSLRGHMTVSALDNMANIFDHTTTSDEVPFLA